MMKVMTTITIRNNLIFKEHFQGGKEGGDDCNGRASLFDSRTSGTHDGRNLAFAGINPTSLSRQRRSDRDL